MRIICFIDSLGSGGAQRQLTSLAVGLKRQGHEVRFLVYHPHDHFLPILESAQIPCLIVPPCSHWRRALAIRRILGQGWQDLVLAFLEGPSLYAELARVPHSRWALVVGERSADPRMKWGTGRWLRHCHRMADAVVSNSHTNRLMISARFPFLCSKLATIYNVVDLQLFRPNAAEQNSLHRPNDGPFRIVVAASYQANKNMMGVAEALLLLKQDRCNPAVVVDWFGAVQSDRTPFQEVERFVSDKGLDKTLRLHPATREIAGEYSRADAVGLFSFFEGLPNAICEGMACGKPIIISDVCDAGNLVRHGHNGFLCDPTTPVSICNAIQHMLSLDPEKRRRMGLESRRMAEIMFDESLVLQRYERVLQSAWRREAVAIGCTWAGEAPCSAVTTVNRWKRMISQSE